MLMCLHCPQCNADKILNFRIESMHKAAGIVPCQNKFGHNARIFGGTHAMAESIGGATEHQGNDTPHFHGVMAVTTPYQVKTLAQIRDLIKKDLSQANLITRFREHM